MKRLTRANGWMARGVAIAGFAAAAGGATAGDFYTTVPYTGTVFLGGKGATPASAVIGKEYSHNTVRTPSDDPNVVSFGDHDAFGTPDPLQVVSWDGLPGPRGDSGSVDGPDFNGPGFNFPEGQVDAIANRGDFLFREVIRNQASLLFSTTLDLAARDAHVRWEDPSGGSGVWASFETFSGGPGPGVNHHPVRDLDGLEVWGPEPPSHAPGTPSAVVEGRVGGSLTADSDRFSLDRDAASGVSVWAFDLITSVSTPWVLHAQAVAAVESAFGVDLPDEIARQVDVDALMARDTAQRGAAGFLPGDEILFSIDPIGGPTGGMFADGGEIIRAYFDPAGGIVGEFLDHGGHLWDTAFDVRGAFGTEFEDVDAIEAVGTLDGPIIVTVPDPTVPEPTAAALALLAAVSAASRRGA